MSLLANSLLAAFISQNFWLDLTPLRKRRVAWYRLVSFMAPTTRELVAQGRMSLSSSSSWNLSMVLFSAATC